MAGLNKYKAYPEYRDSGVEWIDAIPFHWEVLPTFSLCEASTKKNIDGAENNVLSLSYGNITPRDIETNFGLLPESFNTYQLVENGDIILRLTDLQNDKNSLRVGLVKQKGIITSAYLKLSSQGSMLSEYLYRLLHSYDTTKVFYGMGGGLRQSMKFEDFRRLPLLLPSKNEQGKIIDFLDHETAKIDNLIEKQQQLIELLKEKRQAVISHAVTKGLNPDVPMKDSGVEWLGKIPNNWITIKLKFITTLKSEKIILPRTRYVGLENISSGDGNFIVTTDMTPESTSLLFEKDDILFGKLRPYLAKAWLATFSGMCSSEFLVLKVQRLHPKYLNYFILSQSFIKQVDSSTYGTKMPRANWEDIGQLPIPLCTYEESKKIAMYLDKLTTNLDILKEQQLRQIELLKERRTALISAAVTGKIDLRNWTAPIPEAETPTEASA